MHDIWPIWDVEKDCILSKQGDITVAYRMALPEIFTLSNDEYEHLHQTWVKAVKVLPERTVLHKQDWFFNSVYHSNTQSCGNSFLGQAADRYFDGRKYLKHECFLFVTLSPSSRRTSSSAFSSLLQPSQVPKELLDVKLLQKFQDCCSQFASILKDSGLLDLVRLKDQELTSHAKQKGIIERYLTLSTDPADTLMRDIQLGEQLRIGNKPCQLFTLADVEDLPPLCGSRIEYEKYSTDRTSFPVGFAASLGLLLRCNHIYNQYLFIEDGHKVLQKLEKKRLRLQSLSAYSRENSIGWEATNSFLNEAIADQRTPVRASYNLLVWADDNDELKLIRNQVSTALAKMDATAREESVGASQIYWAGIPGNAADFPLNDTFQTFVEQATCFFHAETNASGTTPDKGIRFTDRLSGIPIFLDLYDSPRKAGISSNMGTLCCGTSGGGKSMTLNHMLHSLYNNGAHCVIVDIGGSYKSLCELVNGYYFTYEETNPIKFNPFYLADGMVLDTEKKESLKSLLLALWKQENESYNRSEYVALSNALTGYYAMLDERPEVFPCFDTFYEYLQEIYGDVLKSQQVKERDFDFGNFMYVLKPYYRGGEFDFLLNARDNLDLLNQPFVVIELDNIASHEILFPVVTLLLMEMFISKMRKLAGVRKVLIIDEAWKAIAKSGMAEFLKYAFKTIRKFNGIPGVVTQELDDLISSEIIKDAIINNADVKIMMDMRKFMNKFDKLQETLGMSDKGKTILLSVNKDAREIYIEVGGQLSRVYKNELCPEEYYAFTTDGKERVQVLEYAKKYGSMEKGIAMLVEEKRA